MCVVLNDYRKIKSTSSECERNERNRTGRQSATALLKRKTTKCNVNLETTLWYVVYRMCH